MLHALQKASTDRLKKRVKMLEVELAAEKAARGALEERMARLEARMPDRSLKKNSVRRRPHD